MWCYSSVRVPEQQETQKWQGSTKCETSRKRKTRQSGKTTRKTQHPVRNQSKTQGTQNPHGKTTRKTQHKVRNPQKRSIKGETSRKRSANTWTAAGAEGTQRKKSRHSRVANKWNSMRRNSGSAKTRKQQPGGIDVEWESSRRKQS
ncbi:hypothetical protein BDZ97DRAFT_1982350 [Flammula alnicola]|nr:hypothetical protein BDZ97DRAFT_1982350 [Flammula alnicola]